MTRLVDAYNLYLVKLMQTVQTTNILTVAASLAAETSRVSTTLDRQILLVEDHIAEDVGDRNLSSRDEEQVVEVGMIHLTFLVRQLTCTQTRSLVDNVRRLYLQVSALACLVEEESLQSALEAGHLADIYREACTGNLHTQVEVYQVVLLQQVPVAECVRTQIRFLAAFLYHYVVCCILTLRHLVARYVRDFEQFIGHILLSLLHDFL